MRSISTPSPCPCGTAIIPSAISNESANTESRPWREAISLQAENAGNAAARCEHGGRSDAERRPTAQQRNHAGGRGHGGAGPGRHDSAHLLQVDFHERRRAASHGGQHVGGAANRTARRQRNTRLPAQRGHRVELWRIERIEKELQIVELQPSAEVAGGLHAKLSEAVEPQLNAVPSISRMAATFLMSSSGCPPLTMVCV